MHCKPHLWLLGETLQTLVYHIIALPVHYITKNVFEIVHAYVSTVLS
jgi:hypothetical protein